MTEEEFLQNKAPKVLELLLDNAFRKRFKQYSNEFHKELMEYQKALRRWLKEVVKCQEKASQDKRWRDEESGPPKAGYIWGEHHGYWIPKEPLYPVEKFKRDYKGELDNKQKLKGSYIRLMVIHDVIYPHSIGDNSLGKYTSVLFRHPVFKEANNMVDKQLDNIIEQDLVEVKADLASTKQTETKHKDERSMLMTDAESSKNNWESIKNEYSISKMDLGKKINFVKDQFKRKIIFRDVEHAFVLASQGFSKPALILAGGVIEELLRLYLEHKKIKMTSDRFTDYIKACENNHLLKRGVLHLSDSVRDFRNLVHLKNEKEKRYTISKATAKGAVSSIFTIANDFQ